MNSRNLLFSRGGSRRKIKVMRMTILRLSKRAVICNNSLKLSWVISYKMQTHQR
jgi:hypothetical protein